MTTDLLNPCTDGLKQPGLERTRFYHRQLVTPEDLTQDQVYFREKARRHNRMLHGWGIVCGACVRKGRSDCEVIIEPGYVLGPWGDEIVIGSEVSVDVCKASRREQLGCCDPAPLDPWCDDGPADCPHTPLYLAIRYAECQTRPVRALQSACGCGCDESSCENSRIRDGYSVAVLSELPSTYTTPMTQPNLLEVIPACTGPQRRARSCPPCPDSPWVILADLAVDRNCRVRGVDCFAHRRYVVSFATFYFACGVRTGTVQPITPGARATIARTHALLSGSTDLVDLEAPAGVPPVATVAMTRPEGSTVSVPAYFAVRPGETAADLLEREGDRTFYDPVADDTITLGELYAAADVPGDTPLSGAATALAGLEGRVLSLGRHRLNRELLAEMLRPDGMTRLDQDLGGKPERAAELPASLLAAVAPQSTLARFIADMTIDDVANMDRDEFAAAAADTGSARNRKNVEAQALELWAVATRLRSIRV